MTDIHDNNLDNPEILMPDGLLRKVMDRIEAERARAAIRRRFGFFILSFSGLVLLSYPIWRTFQADIAYSGFPHYLSLMFSDFSLVLSYWQYYALGLLESLPVMSTAGLLAIVFGVIALTKMAFKNRKDFRRYLVGHNF